MSAIIQDCNIEFGIGIEELPDGRARIYVRENIIEVGYDGPAIREFMEATALAWLEQVAPHRINRGSEY